MRIRRLAAADAAAFRAIRIRALREHPDSFLVSAEEEERDPVSAWEERLRSKETTPDDGVLGAFDGPPDDPGRLVGTVGYFRERFEKTRHRAVIWGMYTAPESRGHGVGRALLDAALRDLRALGDVEIVQLSVITTNEAARSLYLSTGFTIWGTDRGAMKVAGRGLDEETMSLRL